ncbi:MAG TPA: sigma-54 dependent transcriptional regulator [Candidatus Binataceae bacterium]|nr:sigma-54 dependent transcriptional regulator [Candidatus Binataceae bacterium]
MSAVNVGEIIEGSSVPDESLHGVSVLVADDDASIRLILRHRLELAGCEVAEAADCASALQALLSNRHAVALLDIMMPGAGGLEVLSQARANGSRTMVIVITAASTMNNAVEAMRRGAHDYLTKPFDNLESVVAATRRALESAAQHDHRNHPTEVTRRFGGEIFVRSPAMQEVFKLIGRVVSSDATLLLTGESGTGKEVVAREIHRRSSRAAGPFIAVNCSAIPQGLLESELFGHERGSFTGATERRAGKFEQAAGGTIFLDEIGDLPLELQPKLLRVLQEREFTRVGGTETLRAQARVIAATNQQLEQAVAERRFREDLYFRLRVVPVHIPPLRERREDIPELTDHFIEKARESGARARGITPEARARLQAYDWPGNVRELENAVLRAALLTPGPTIRVEDLELGSAARPPRPAPGDLPPLEVLIRERLSQLVGKDGPEPRDLHQKIIAELEKPLIELALERARGNQVQAARILGLNRNTLRKKLAEHAISITRTPGT